jgi:cytochrome b subunit of formate dehydrogenase
MCGRCHGDLKFVVEQPGLFSTRPFFAYQQSVHGRAVEQGKSEAAICTDCHGAHEVTGPDDPRSPIFRTHIPGTCGRCHAPVYAEYRESIHGEAAARGIGAAPVCTSCHGIHSIRSPVDPESRVSARAVARSTCAQCHQSEQLTDDFGVPRQRVESYYDSFHGLESRLGSVATANCASCHGVHNILPSSDPRSTIHEANLPSTCGRCHPGASDNFARGQIHLVSGVSGPRDGEPPAPDPFGTRAVRLVRDLYISLIVVVIGGMAVHNLIDFVARARRRLAGLAAAHAHVRLTLAERLQHAALGVSFVTLVVTGFALKFPGSAWVRWLFLGSPDVRSILHRVAGVALILLAVWHVAWLAASRRGREQLRALRPGLEDALDLMGSLRHNLGLSPHPPAFGRFTYAEKAEYWALVWGTGLMAATGVILWAEGTALRWMPKWGFDVVEVIHYYEAWLATLAIVVWHLYFTLLRPGNHTLRWAWLTGRLSDEEWREEHPAEHARARGSAPAAGNQGGEA